MQVLTLGESGWLRWVNVAPTDKQSERNRALIVLRWLQALLMLCGIVCVAAIALQAYLGNYSTAALNVVLLNVLVVLFCVVRAVVRDW
jgi:hypothetical protein